MGKKQTYKELEKRIKELETKALESKQSEEALKELQRYTHGLIEINLDALVTISAEGKITDINHATELITGISREEIIGTDFSNYFTEAETANRGYQQVFRDGYVRDYPLEIKHRDGRIIPVFYNASVYKNAQGRVTGVFAAARDMTEIKRAEEQIKEYSQKLEEMVKEKTRALYDSEKSRDKIDGILKSIADGLIVTDIYNRIVLMNRAAEDMLDVHFSEVIDRPIDVAIKDETLRNLFKTSLEEREPGYQFDFELPGENSKDPRIIRARTSEIKDTAGNQTGIITIIHDVTLERKVDRMKTEFISAAAHQLRTPLTSLQGFSEILMTRDNIKKEQQKEFISHINKQSVNLANIINDLLDISRIESGMEFTLHKVSCDINEIIRKTVKYFQVAEPERQFDIILPKEPLELVADKDKIGQVLENILGNAVKYSPEGGSICLTAKRIADFGLQNSELEGHEKEFALRTPQSAIEISVADQGIGMSSDQVEKIFDKFYRVDVSNRAVPGTGLGMSIVKNYVEAHGGKVWVESELGKGTVVKFVLQI
ncbi:MAG: PAS domain S-box protein [Desulfobacterales bacterium]|uniref:histidine kinase n=1 Tax=Candidatus Desulfaltia bathyphila TaxID=2841697 RepID=A0A8J6N3N4_9BACT|nr:PAS domain S-box protein [Candidatus Desulfaltia bathyphila]MBL7195530.1 PAS domain S-box protein [Desulfobacterales bacterium]MBL7207390.1 PAS domain S-box protein [Desulfobacterales bacterium]